ncbi:FAD-binding oxidoreductase [Candidatus Saccharibacteria bacterium]|nr:FAD-binding oxidoreductase [Candidatus Saccharibacteria bacterium]
MGKLAQYLQEHLMGEALDGVDVLRHFSRDASVLQIDPEVVVYPKNEQDVRKVVRFCWQLAERGKHIGITSRGAGTDLAGASVGNGIILAFPAHMNKVVSLDSKKHTMEVEPGATIGKVEQAFNVQYRSLPSMPGSAEYATIGGAVANNSGGAYSQKYGPIGKYVRSLRVVLANGEVINVHKLSKRELNKKMGLANFEGQIYRQLDTMLNDNDSTVKTLADNSPGFSLKQIRKKNSFDLTPLFVGAQGTLGIITEVSLSSEPYNPQPGTILASFSDIDSLVEAVAKIRKFNPAALEMVDGWALRQVAKIAPTALRPVFKQLPEFVLLIEFDDETRDLKKHLKATEKILKSLKVDYERASNNEERDRLWKVRNSVGHIISESHGRERYLPGLEDAAVPQNTYAKFYKQTMALFEKHKLPFAAWGRVGMGQLSVMPKIDLSETSGRQRLYRLLNDYHHLVSLFGGKLALHHNDGRIRGQYQALAIGPEAYELMRTTKTIFDPHNILNPGVKVNVDRPKTLGSTRTSYSMSFYTHLPRL